MVAKLALNEELQFSECLIRREKKILMFFCVDNWHFLYDGNKNLGSYNDGYNENEKFEDKVIQYMKVKKMKLEVKHKKTNKKFP